MTSFIEGKSDTLRDVKIYSKPDGEWDSSASMTLSTSQSSFVAWAHKSALFLRSMTGFPQVFNLSKQFSTMTSPAADKFRCLPVTFPCCSSVFNFPKMSSIFLPYTYFWSTSKEVWAFCSIYNQME